MTTNTTPDLSRTDELLRDAPATVQKARGISLPCPCCSEHEASIIMWLDDQRMSCSECDGEFTIEDVRRFQAEVRRWDAVLAWMSQMPGEEVAEEAQS